MLTTGIPTRQKTETKEKIIYAKRKPVSKETLNEILKLEVEYHLRNNPTYAFAGYGKVIENPDRSKIFPIIFNIIES